MGLLVPCDLVRMSLMPAVSITARIAPPEMTPVPGSAGSSSIGRYSCSDSYFHPCLTRRVGQRLDSSVIEETTAVEHDGVHTGGLGLGGDRFPDLHGLGHAVALRLQLDRRRGRDGAACRVV